MKLNWGTGIFIFLILFITAGVAFIIFTLQYDVNLVHKDYYEKGVDYSEQMNVEKRSTEFKNAFKITNQNNLLILNIDESLSSKIDSGRILLFKDTETSKG